MNKDKEKIEKDEETQDNKTNADFVEDELSKSKKDLEDLLQQLQMKINETDKNVKIIKVKVPTKKEKVFNAILTYIISFLAVSSISGYIHWIEYDKFYHVLILAALIPIIENFVDYLIERFFFKYILYSFGIILVIAPIVSFFSLSIALPFITINNVLLTFLVIAIYVIIKKLLLSFFKGLKKNDNIIKEK